MKVKIGDTTYDSETQPIMVILDQSEKKLISEMAGDNNKFCCFPDGEESITEFMKTDDPYHIKVHNDGKEKHQSFETILFYYNEPTGDIGYGDSEESAIENLKEIVANKMKRLKNKMYNLGFMKYKVSGYVDWKYKPIKKN